MTRLESLLASLADHLEATGERPVATETSRWLGEAEAVATDLAGADTDALSDDTVLERVGHVRRLLENATPIEDEAARDHVAAALRAVDRIEDRLTG